MSKLARRTAAPRFRRSGPGAKAMARVAASKASAAARNSATRAARNGTMLGGIAAGLFGYAEKSGTALPTVAGINPSLLYGGLLGVVIPMFIKGSTGRIAEQVGSGLLDVAAYKLGAGMPVLSGEYDDVAGDW